MNPFVSSSVPYSCDPWLFDAKQRVTVHELRQWKKCATQFWLPKRPSIYLWGSVGSGKTTLMHYLFDSLPFKKKKRIHFHAYMDELYQMVMGSSVANPVKKWIQNQHLSCLFLDEFMVRDIAEAMFLGQVLKNLHQNRVICLATSNQPPHQLYTDGLNRQAFLPTIRYIEKHFKILEMSSFYDYRLIKHPDLAPNLCLWQHYAQRMPTHIQHIVMQTTGHIWAILGANEDCIMMSLDQLCGIPRSKADYLELSKRYRLLLLDCRHAQWTHDFVYRFIEWADIWYDAGHRMIYQGSLLHHDPQNQAFQRALSRVHVMNQ